MTPDTCPQLPKAAREVEGEGGPEVKAWAKPAGRDFCSIGDPPSRAQWTGRPWLNIKTDGQWPPVRLPEMHSLCFTVSLNDRHSGKGGV